ncbi:MAG TPA: GspH/FimT family pseudopilin [Xanthomonadales bacterium]
MKTRQPKGLTALELIVTMAIIAILLSSGVPAFKNYGLNLRMRTAMDTLQSDLKLARGRAISHNIQTVICPATDSNDCSGQSTWHDGWIVFTDLNGDRHKQPGEHLLRQAGSVELLNISSSVARSNLRFYPNGSAPGSNASILFCDSRGAASAGTITVSNSGRILARTNGAEPSEICP